MIDATWIMDMEDSEVEATQGEGEGPERCSRIKAVSRPSGGCEHGT